MEDKSGARKKTFGAVEALAVGTKNPVEAAQLLLDGLFAQTTFGYDNEATEHEWWSAAPTTRQQEGNAEFPKWLAATVRICR